MLASYRERVTGVRTHESRHYHSMIAPQESPSALADDLPRLDIQAGGRFASPNPPLHQHELQHSAGESSKDKLTNISVTQTSSQLSRTVEATLADMVGRFQNVVFDNHRLA